MAASHPYPGCAISVLVLVARLKCRRDVVEASAPVRVVKEVSAIAGALWGFEVGKVCGV